MGKLFDGLFDFNGDGKTSMFEAILGINMMQEKGQSSKMQSGLSNDYLPASMPGLCPSDALALEHQEEEIQELQDQVEELHSQLEELEWDEPSDWTSEAHVSWEEARDELENRIEDLENTINDVDSFF